MSPVRNEPTFRLSEVAQGFGGHPQSEEVALFVAETEARIRADQTERIVTWLRERAGEQPLATMIEWRNAADAIDLKFGGIDKGGRDDG